MNYTQAADALLKDFPDYTRLARGLFLWNDWDLSDPRALLKTLGMIMLTAVELYIMAYNDILFRGQLPLEKCPVEIIATTDSRWVSNSSGYSVDQRNIVGRGSPATITSPIKIMECVQSARSLSTDLKVYSSVALTFQIHSWFSTYCCFCNDCSAVDDQLRMATEGKTGFGFPFFRVANVFEVFMQDLSGMNIDLDLARCMAWELYGNDDLDRSSFRMSDYGLVRSKVVAIVRNIIDADAHPYYEFTDPSTDDDEDDALVNRSTSFHQSGPITNPISEDADILLLHQNEGFAGEMKEVLGK
jgi:hypothetical protein